MTHSSSPLSEMPSPSVPPPEPPMTFTTKSMTEKSKSREDTIREALDKAARMKKSKSREDTIREALNKVRRRSKDRTSEFASHRSMSLRNMKRRSAGSTNDVMMKEGSTQNKFILSRSGKSSGALLSSSSSRWKDSPRTQHQRTNSGENNLLVKLELLMRNTRWFNQTWTPKRFEIQGGVLIKYPKKKQDLRVDLPTIGLDTLKDCKKAGLRGIVLKNKQNIFLEKNKCINFANKNKMFILVK